MVCSDYFGLVAAARCWLAEVGHRPMDYFRCRPVKPVLPVGDKVAQLTVDFEPASARERLVELGLMVGMI